MKKINVAELLKGCPSGMELDCTMYENVYFDQIFEIENCLYSIGCYTIIDGIRTSINFTKFGEFNTHRNSKCVIFPKGKTTWEGFQIPFKDGDIVATDLGSVFILKSCLEDNIHYHSYIGVTCCNEIQEKQIPFAYKYVCHLATEEEKAKLFDAIKDNGYKWNAETKTLEKLIEPKFNVGDRIRRKNSNEEYTIISISDYTYYYRLNEHCTGSLGIQLQDDYELVHNKFDINTLVPFESRVLVRNDESQYWIPAFWGYKRSKYATTFGWCNYCIPFNGNEHLLETNDDCDEFYKTWKN